MLRKAQQRIRDRIHDRDRGQAQAAEIRANVRSIHEVPLDVLPAGELRTQLVAHALDGQDIYCYQSGGSQGVWCLWQHNMRVPLEEVVADYESAIAQREERKHVEQLRCTAMADEREEVQ